MRRVIQGCWAGGVVAVLGLGALGSGCSSKSEPEAPAACIAAIRSEDAMGEINYLYRCYDKREPTIVSDVCEEDANREVENFDGQTCAELGYDVQCPSYGVYALHECEEFNAYEGDRIAGFPEGVQPAPAGSDDDGGSTGNGGSGGNTGPMRACSTPNGHICTELVTGDATAYAAQCASDGRSVAACPANPVLGCEGATADSAGAPVTVNVYWYDAACNNEIQPGQTCNNGTQVGTGCQ